jgi:copper chaperone CopZ
VKTDPDKKEAIVTYDDSKVTTDRMVQAAASDRTFGSFQTTARTVPA